MEKQEEYKVKEKPKPKTRKKYVHARAIASKGESVLVEWFDDDKMKRGYIPLTEFDHETSRANQTALKAAIQYGVDWSKMKVEIDTELLDSELKRCGFWTPEDLETNPQLVNIILMRVAGLNRQALKEAK